MAQQVYSLVLAPVHFRVNLLPPVNATSDGIVAEYSSYCAQIFCDYELEGFFLTYRFIDVRILLENVFHFFQHGTPLEGQGAEASSKSACKARQVAESAAYMV